MMRRTVAFSVMLILLAGPSAVMSQPSDPKPVVAVFDLRVEGVKVSPNKRSTLSGYLSSRLTAGGVYLVAPASSIREALIEQKKESHKDCYDQFCQIKIGQAIAANMTLSSLIWRVGNKCSLNLDLYDVRTEAMVNSVEVPGLTCDEAGLKEGIGRGAAKLSGHEWTDAPMDAGAPGGVAQSVVIAPTASSPILPASPVVNAGGGRNGGDDTPPPVAAETGYLSVEGSPKGAQVDISGPSGFGAGGKAATSLPMAPMKVPVGRYRVAVGMAGYDQEERSALVYADSNETVRVDLIQSTAQVEISGKPEGARSRIECQKGFARDFVLPTTAWTATVPRGQCRLTVERDGYEKYDAIFEVAGGSVVRQTVELMQDVVGSGISAGGGATPGKGGIQWVRLPGGTFQRDSNSVTLSTFELAATEVTVGQYRKCVDAGVCSAPDSGGYCNWGKPGRENHPINCVDWGQATAYAKWVGGRLPTEAEWEYAARSGGRNQEYPWGNQAPDCRYAVIDDGSTRKNAGLETDGCGRDSTWPVCSKPAGNTAQGLCDMAGNVWEWISDWYGDYPSGPLANPTGPSWGLRRVYRGGSWNYAADVVSTANRRSGGLAYRYGMGFRPARSVR